MSLVADLYASLFWPTSGALEAALVDFVTVAERLGAFLEGTRVAELLALLCDLPAERLLS